MKKNKLKETEYEVEIKRANWQNGLVELRDKQLGKDLYDLAMNQGITKVNVVIRVPELDKPVKTSEAVVDEFTPKEGDKASQPEPKWKCYDNGCDIEEPHDHNIEDEEVEKKKIKCPECKKEFVSDGYQILCSDCVAV